MFNIFKKTNLQFKKEYIGLLVEQSQSLQELAIRTNNMEMLEIINKGRTEILKYL